MHSAATIDVMETRLREWGAWLTRGGSGDGYATKSVLHPSWMPPSPGQLPTMKVSHDNSRRERALHDHHRAQCPREAVVRTLACAVDASTDAGPAQHVAEVRWLRNGRFAVDEP